MIMVMIPDQNDQADGHNDGDGEMMCFSTTCDNHVYGKLSVETLHDYHHQVTSHCMVRSTYLVI